MKKFYFITGLLQFVFIVVGYSQVISGDWYGIGNFSGIEKRICLHINNNGSIPSATYDSSDQEDSGLPVDVVKISGNLLNLKSGAQSFQGVIDGKCETVSGIWKYYEGTTEIIFRRQPVEIPENSLVNIRKQYDKQEVSITMRDGIRLFTSIYTPVDKTEKHPLLLWRTPYNSEPDPDKYAKRLLTMYHLLKENYIIVFQDVRGRYQSEGQFMDVRPYIPDKKSNETDENSDSWDTIDWLIKNVENNNGNVGMFGISYPGFYASMALPNAHPALKAVSPQAPVSNWFLGDDWHHNGAFFMLDAFSFYANFGRPRSGPTRKPVAQFDFKSEDNYDFFMNIGPLKNVSNYYFGDTIQFWSDLMAHGIYDQFWKERTVHPHLTNIKPAVMVVGGWFDAEDLFGPLKTYEAIETQNRNNRNILVMGPWYHGQWTEGVGEQIGNIHFGDKTSKHFKALELQFFNYYLKNKGEMNLPEASIFITGSNEWRAFESWPPAGIIKKELYIDCNSNLSFNPPATEECYDEYMVDPDNPVPYTEDVHLARTKEYLTDDQRFASRRSDVMVYKTGILDSDITFTGPLNVTLFVSTTGTDADYVVKLIDVFPDETEDYPENEKGVPVEGYQMLVRGDVMRGKFRKSFENPVPFLPGEITEVSFEIPDLAHTFKKGHRIMVQIQNSWFPLVDRNPQKFVNIYEADAEDFIKATHRIYHDSKRPSRISVSILNE
ncbi:MAG: CocE/NonD family hydrolase [Prolixibacteraceae bacterium]|nr:CocE/NonD family hydrolase [Prolixibacteraceae bacterium]